MPAEGDLVGSKLGAAAGFAVAPNPASLAMFTTPGLLFPRLSCQPAQDVIQLLSNALMGEGLVSQATDISSPIFARESFLSSYTTPDWAIPHVRGNFSRLGFAFAHCPGGITWFCGRRVRTIFLCVVPESEAMTYLSLLSTLARLSQSYAQMAAVLQATTPGAVFAQLAKIPFRGERQDPS